MKLLNSSDVHDEVRYYNLNEVLYTPPESKYSQYVLTHEVAQSIAMHQVMNIAISRELDD